MAEVEMTETRERVRRVLVTLCAMEPSKAEFARKCGTSQQNVQNWVKGINMPPVEKLVEISEIYGLSLDMMVGRAVATDALPPDEAELLEHYRGMDEASRRALLDVARCLDA